MARQGSGFARHAFHEVAISADRVDVEIENVESGTIEIFRQPFAGDGHSHAVPRSLSQRPGRGFHPARQMGFGMPRGSAVDLPEALDLLHRLRALPQGAALHRAASTHGPRRVRNDRDLATWGPWGRSGGSAATGSRPPAQDPWGPPDGPNLPAVRRRLRGCGWC